MIFTRLSTIILICPISSRKARIRIIIILIVSLCIDAMSSVRIRIKGKKERK